MTTFESVLVSMLTIAVMVVLVMMTEQSTTYWCHRAAIEAGVAHEVVVTNSTTPLRVSVVFQYKTNLSVIR